MRHHNANRKFGRVKRQREELLIGLAKSLITHGKIKTTEARAKELRPFIEKMITRAGDNSIANKRLIASRLKNDKESMATLFESVAPKYKERKGGYTRIVKMPARQGDASPMAIIELV